MKVGAVPENVIERVVLKLNQVPTPFVDTMATFVLARTIMVATKLGVFDELEHAPGGVTAGELAKRKGTNPRATAKLLDTLVGAGYLTYSNRRYSLGRVAKKWMPKDSPTSLHDAVILRFIEWEWLTHLEEFVVSGKSLDIHSGMLTKEDWQLYQRGMRALAGVGSGEVIRRTPVPDDPREMLDIGGSHGLYSVLLCKKHPRLRSTILDLPEAIEHAAPILAKEGMGDRVKHKPGNALKDDLGTNQYDIVFTAQLVHHFDEATNRELTKRVARALRPGGVFVIHEAIRPSTPAENGGTGALLDLFFALTSECGTWSYEEMAGWQRDAGLVPKKPIKFMTVPGFGLQAATKPAH